uniref:Ubiquitin-like domain-containing protein n=1 Tax=Anopheles epiroticus TaxID=199890 RepID=A0A182P493_9DIPT
MDVTLIVKASNQQCEDLTIKCEPSWTIRRLKGHLTEVYPGKPSTDEQKLIYSGQLLSDSVVLKDVLRHTSSREGGTEQTTTVDGGSGSDGLRHRAVPQASSAARTNLPRPAQFIEQTAALQAYMQTYMQCFNQYVNLINEQANANALNSGTVQPGAAQTTTPTLVSGAQPFPAVPFVPMVQPTTMPGAFPNLAYYPCMATGPFASNIPMAASSNVGSNASGSNSFLPSSGMPSTSSGQPTPTSQIPGPSGTGLEAGDGTTVPGTSGEAAAADAAAPAEQGVAQDAAAPAAGAAAGAPARARRFPNIVVEEQENNDWLDVFFSMCRVGILITVIYLYSSPIRCLTVLFIGVMLYLKKHFDRLYQAFDRRAPRLQPVPEGGAPPRDQQQQPAGGVAAQPNNNVPEQSPEQRPPHDSPNVGTSGTENTDKRESSEAGPSSSAAAGNEPTTAAASSSGRAVVPRPRTGPLADPNAAEQQEQQQQQEPQANGSDGGEPGTVEQPAAEGQRMTLNDMTSFLGTLVITFFTSIIPDTPAA